MPLFHTGALRESLRSVGKDVEDSSDDGDDATFVAPAAMSTRSQTAQGPLMTKGGGKNRAPVELTTGQCEY